MAFSPGTPEKCLAIAAASLLLALGHLKPWQTIVTICVAISYDLLRAFTRALFPRAGEMSKALSFLLLLAGACAMGVSMVRLPAIEPFRDALAWLGYSLGAIANTPDLMSGLRGIVAKK